MSYLLVNSQSERSSWTQKKTHSQHTAHGRPSIMKEQLTRSLLSHAHGELEYHKANVKVYLNNPVGIGEHPDVMGAITSEIEKVAYWEDQVQVLEKYFK